MKRNGKRKKDGKNRPFKREEDKNDNNCRSQQFCPNATSKFVLHIRNDDK